MDFLKHLLDPRQILYGLMAGLFWRLLSPLGTVEAGTIIIMLIAILVMLEYKSWQEKRDSTV